MKWKKFLLGEPFILGLIAGILTGNLSLGLITTGFSILIWGYRSGINFIILSTIILVVITGNINFELIFVYFLTLAYLIKKRKILRFLDQKISYIIIAFISIISFPLWKLILGFIPVRILNEINISGEILLVTALIYNIKRGVYLIRKGSQSEEIIRFLIIILMASLGIRGKFIIVPFWILGSILIYYLDIRSDKINNLNLSINLYYFVLVGLIGILLYILLPLNIILIVGIIVLLFTYLGQKKIQLLEVVYLSLLLGMIAGRLGLLS